MAAPSFAVASTGSTDAGGAWTAGGQAGAPGRLTILQVLQDGSTDGAVSFTSFSNVNALDGTTSSMTKIVGPNSDGSWPIGNPEVARQFLYIGREPSGNVTSASGGNSTSEDLYWRWYSFTDASAGTTLATVIEGCFIDCLSRTTSNSPIGSTSSYEKQAQSFSFASTTPLKCVELYLYKTGSPTDNLVIELQSDSSGSPSGTVITTLGTIAGADLTTGFYSFPCDVSLSASTTYWIVLRRSGSLNGSNYFQTVLSLDGYSGGTNKRLASSVWTDNSIDLAFRLSGPGGVINWAATGASVNDTPVVTVGPDRLALNLVAINDDNAISDFTNETGGDWTLAVAGYAESSGTDGAIGLEIAKPGQALSYTGRTSPHDYIYGGTGTSEQSAQSFMTPNVQNITLYKAQLWLVKTGSPTDNVLIDVQTDASGSPSGTALDTYTYSAASLDTVGKLVGATDLAIRLSPNTKYWIVVRRSGARDTTNCFFTTTMLTGDYANGDSKWRDNGTWSLGLYDHAFALGLAYQTTIDGGSFTQADGTDGWGVVGFALRPSTAFFDQVAYRFRNDDGDETGATWKDALNTNITIGTNETFRLRLALKFDGDPASNSYDLQASINGGAWGSINNAMSGKTSTYYASGNTTQQITSGGSFYGTGGLQETNLGVANYNPGFDQIAELEFCMAVRNDQGLQTGDTIDLRFSAGLYDTESWSHIARVTVGTSGPTEYTDSATTTVDIQADGTEYRTQVYADTDTDRVSLTPSATEIHEIPDSASLLVDLQASGEELLAKLYTDADTDRVSLTPSSVEIREIPDSATVLVDLQASGSELQVFVEAATPLVDLQADGSELKAHDYPDTDTALVDIQASTTAEDHTTFDSATVGNLLTPSATEIKAHDYSDTDTALVDVQASGTDVQVYVESAEALVDIQASGTDLPAKEYTDSATDTVVLTPSTADIAVLLDSAETLVDLQASGDEFPAKEYLESAEALVDLQASGTDEFVPPSGTPYEDSATDTVVLTPSTEDVHDIPDASTITVVLTASATELAEFVESATAPVALTPSSTEEHTTFDATTTTVALSVSDVQVAELVDAATTPVDIEASSADVMVSVDSAELLIDIQASGADIAILEDVNTIPLSIQTSATEEHTTYDSETVSELLSPSFTEVHEIYDATTATLALTPDTADIHEIPDATTITNVLTPSATEEHTTYDDATSPLSLAVSGTDELAQQYTDTAETLVDLAAESSELAEFVDSDTSTVDIQASGEELAERADAAETVEVITPSGADILEGVDAETVLLVLSPSSVEYMPQILRPNADVDANNWQVAPLWEKVSDVNDSTYIYATAT